MGLGMIGYLLLMTAALAAAAPPPVPQGPQRLTATPRTLPDVLDRARGGDTILLAPGDYGEVLISRRSWAQPVTIDARLALLALRIQESNGLRLTMGVVRASPATNRGISIDRSRDIEVTGPTIRRAEMGIMIARSQDVKVRNAALSGIDVDGIQVAMSQNVELTDITCRDWAWTPDNPLHPDCIQLFPRTGADTTDVTVTRVTATGPMQGVMARADAGGRLKRVSLRGLRTHLEGTSVYLKDCDDCEVIESHARTLPTARWQSRIFAPGSRQTGNKVEGFLRWPGWTN